MAVVGLIYTLRQGAKGLEGPVNKRMYATFSSHRTLFEWLRREADKRGYGRKRVLFLADGSEHIWRLQSEFFPEAKVCLDWYHVVEKLWTAGGCFHREGSQELHRWVSEQQQLLREDGVSEVLDELRRRLAATPKTGPGNKGRRERLDHAIRYLDGHRDRMRYGSLRAQDLDIGTGAVEGAIRNLVRMRLDGPGMRWGRGRSEHVLHLRCILLNNQWEEFADYLARRGQLTLAAQAEPATPYTAKAAA
jgi:hypothetical protein